MTVSIPTVGHALSAKATELTNFKTIASGSNAQLALSAKAKIVQLQEEIVNALMASGELPASAILNTMTFRAADTN
jgi:hypothetical protein